VNYETFQPHPDIASLVKCYWTLEIPASPDTPKQRVVPDGCIEMMFILGDDVKRYTSEKKFIIQPRSLVLGQITKPFYVQPTGHVNTFAVRFYPYGFANFVTTPIKELANKETPVHELFGKSVAKELERSIVKATNTTKRIKIVEKFLRARLLDRGTIDSIVKTTIDAILSTRGSTPINSILLKDLSKRRQLERKFLKQVGISPKQLGKVIRLQAALKVLLRTKREKLTAIAYDSEYYDQSHFIKDFKKLTGTNPGDFLRDDEMILSSLIYRKE
jgi:AraC-like DNA-binding protein